MQEITITLNLNEANAILGSLGKQPYDEVAGLIAKIREQALEQLNPVSEEVPAIEPDHE